MVQTQAAKIQRKKKNAKKKRKDNDSDEEEDEEEEETEEEEQEKKKGKKVSRFTLYSVHFNNELHFIRCISTRGAKKRSKRRTREKK